MSHPTSSSTSLPNFDSIFNSALDAYKKHTKQDLTSHPLLPSLQACNSPHAVLTVFREQFPTFTRSQSPGGGLTTWLVSTVNVIYAFSAIVGTGVSLVFPPAQVIFAGVGVLFSAAKDVGAGREILIDVFTRVQYYFKRLEIYTNVPATDAMRNIMVDIMVEVISFPAIATKEVKRGRAKKYLKKLIGNTDVEDALRRMDRLTLEEAHMASLELLRISHNVESRVVCIGESLQGVEDKVQGVGEGVRGVRDAIHDVGDGVQDVRNAVQDVDDRVQVVLDAVQDVGDGVQDVQQLAQGLDNKVDQVNRNDLRERLRIWLSPSNPSINHNIACDAQHKGSAQWFFRGTIFNQWKSTGPFLWVHGKPGSGKSVLSAAIIQDIMRLRDSGNASIAYFYFDFRDTDKQRLRNLLPSLLIQLSARSDSRCDTLARLYSDHDNGVQKPSDRAMTECLKKMLALPLLQGPTYIILDALDECPNNSGIPSPRKEVLQLVNHLVDLRLPNLHICVTSRPEIDIQAILQHLTPHPVSLHDESGQKQDIVNYVTSVVHSDDTLRRWRDEDKELVIKTLSEKADGMFRWVFCQLEILSQSFPSSVRRILEELPESLDQTYERLLREIRKANQGHAYRLLQCLVVAVRPLRVEELAEVLAVDFEVGGTPMLNPGWRWFDHQEAVLSACSGLVTIIKDGDSRIVQFSHFSVKEYLTSDRLAESSRNVSRYHIQLATAHTILAQACLGVLLRLDNDVDQNSINNFPLARYAAEYWVEHAQFENVSSRIEDGMDCLFDVEKPYFATWLWIYNEDRPFGSLSSMHPSKPEAVPLYHAALHGFRDLVKHLLAKHPDHINAEGGSLMTPLRASAEGRHSEVFSLLVDNFPDVNAQVGWGLTALHLASSGGRLEIGKRLICRGAVVNARSDANLTPLWLATHWERLELVRMLIEHGALVDARSDEGETPLHQASRCGHIDIMKLLLENGADLGALNMERMTPSEVASSNGLRGVVQLLIDYGQGRLKGQNS